jgi:hypothetical protein
MPAELARNRRGIRDRSFLINLAILFLVLAAGTAVAVIWGNPIPVHVSATTLGSKIVFGWLVALPAFHNANRSRGESKGRDDAVAASDRDSAPRLIGVRAELPWRQSRAAV